MNCPPNWLLNKSNFRSCLLILRYFLTQDGAIVLGSTNVALVLDLLAPPIVKIQVQQKLLRTSVHEKPQAKFTLVILQIGYT